MDKVFYDKSLQIERDSGVESDSSGDLVEFEGVISDNTLDSHYTRMAPSALRSYAKDASKEVPVLPEHNRRGQPIGRSISGKYNQKSKKVSAKFYVQRGLELSEAGYANTDSYISAMQAGTARDLSIGARVNKMTCDTCTKEMKPDPFFGWLFPLCEKGHFPGRKIKDEETGKVTTVTASITDANLSEFSVVSVGANKNTQVIQKIEEAAKKGVLTNEHLERLQVTYNIARSDLDIDLSSLHEVHKMSKDTDATKDEDETLDNEDQNSNVDTELLDLRAENAGLKSELQDVNDLLAEYEESTDNRLDTIQELKDKVSKLERIEEENEILKEDVADRDKTITKLQSRIGKNRQNEDYAERYRDLLEEARADCEQAYISATGYRSNSDEVIRKRKSWDKNENYGALRSRARKYWTDAADEADEVRDRKKRKASRSVRDDINADRYTF